MDIKQLQAIVIDALEDVKAIDIALFDTTQLTGMFDRLIVASGNSNRQTKALAASVRDKVREKGGTVVGMEGEETGEWVLVDLGDMVVHIMQPPIRAYYRLEEIWGGNEIDIAQAKADAKKKPATKKVTAKAEAPKKAPAKKAPAKKTTAKATTEKAKKAVAKTTKTTTAKKTTATKAVRKTTTKKTS